MKIIKPSYEILTPLNGTTILKNIEIAGRTAYKSEDKITEDSAEDFVNMLVKRGHLSVIEHQSFSVRFVVDRGVSHEMVRHRLASFTQESTRYCNYVKDKYDNQLNIIIPSWFSVAVKNWLVHNGDATYMTNAEAEWYLAMENAEMSYIRLIEEGWKPQQARSVLPNSLKTEIVVTANLREWRVIFQQRTAKTAHPQIREVMCPLLNEIKTIIPIIFNDINYE